MSTLQAVSTADIHGYSTGEIARMAGLGPGQVRAFVRDGLLEPRRQGQGPYRFSFTDLVLLRKARELFAQGFITQPQNDNVVALLREVDRLDPGNQALRIQLALMDKGGQ